MAYNILKGDVQFVNSASGTIESMVNDFQAQVIAGVKTFTNVTSGSAFYDTTNSGYLTPFSASLTNVDSTANRVMTSNGDGTLNCEANMTFDGSSLNIVGHVTASTFSGSGVGLTNIPADSFSGLISGDQIDYGNGLTSSAGTLSVEGSSGIDVTATGVRVDIATNAGLNFIGEKLTVDASVLTAIASPADADQLIIQDVAPTSAVKNITLSNLYSNYLANKLPVTAFTNNVENRLITVSSTTSAIEGEANLTFNSITSVLEVNGDAIISGSQYISSSLAIGENDTNRATLYMHATSSAQAFADPLTLLVNSPDHDTIFAVAQWNQITCGGTYTDALFNITGSDSQKLIAVKSDSVNPAFYISGSGDAFFSGNVGIGTQTPNYDLHVNGTGVTELFVDGGAGSDSFLRLGTAGTAKSYVKLGSGGNLIVANDATGGDLLLKAKPSGVSTTYLTLDSSNTALTASVDMRIDGDLDVLGSIRGKMLETTRHSFNNGNASAVFVPFAGIIELVGPDYRHQMVVPHDGRLVKALVRTKNAQSGNVTLELYVAGNGTEDFNAGGTSVEQVTLAHGGANTTETYSFSGSSPFTSGDIVGIKIDPNAAPGDVNVTCVWEYYNL